MQDIFRMTFIGGILGSGYPYLYLNNTTVLQYDSTSWGNTGPNQYVLLVLEVLL